ncbi:hypothetical protein PIROE2DRAFT_12097 [Piromyces sp. E2]|nr:hypothetical protein PIROE2DRAFT_12097 [Piromyces sp. E2]|eukprot:OUM61794.1 hypothetical protein PIROE2DRAFT_12097 [Piromyces sp. E2]
MEIKNKYVILTLFILCIPVFGLLYIYYNNKYIYNNILKYNDYNDIFNLSNSFKKNRNIKFFDKGRSKDNIDINVASEEEEEEEEDDDDDDDNNNNNLSSFEVSGKDLFDNVYCGIWQEQYTKFHREMEASNNKKYLILDAHQCGWGDRFIQIVSGFYVALLSKRSFKIIGINLENVFDKPNIDWSLDEKELKRLKKNKSIKELYYTGDKSGYYNEGFLYTNFTSNYEDYEALRYRIQNGKIVKIFENPFHKKQLYEMGLRPETAYGYYEANSKIDYLPSNDEPVRIGIQIRTGDDVFKGGKSNYCKGDVMNSTNIIQYFDCAQSLENEIFETPYNKPSGSLSMKNNNKKKRKIYWFLITDCKILRKKAKKLWPEKIITITDKTIDHLEKTKNEESINLTFAEHWLFGEMDYHIISRASCYGRTASLRRKVFQYSYL